MGRTRGESKSEDRSLEVTRYLKISFYFKILFPKIVQ